MLRELVWLQLIAVTMTLPVHQQSTTNENDVISSISNILTSAADETESFSEPIESNKNEIALEPISTPANQPANITTANIVLGSMTTNGTDVLSENFVLKEKKKAKNPFPFYAYILFGLVPLFILFILLC